ncbi:hypothetical protein TPHA_0E03420 [Tetrapisispora phaffii CBS 4417]|uniref:Prefoldin subunit 1 n=1 Tax=Tetrapisispora phaffii (strain ATCC 24235 / CBS 4417 / NBRC 1672 / NRRL Y-8282 / UCD 70-5) TaxID=1071381 RepID=G8BU54_TETPH|nr:hypothetical protein TPHA_0E03420 [Tetrapisispora phaffii CBS 4417]CCE63432.1 hypothetical protein TPHA_0E03420 [Tetrapisispora phaffii CBS 4417]
MSDMKLVQEMTTSLRNNKAQLDMVNQQISHLDRQGQIAQLTADELGSYPNNEVWRSCGKAFILQSKDKYVTDLKHDENVINEQKKR